jgi:chain length determinant protein tyrosine kinase EpsG
MPRTVSPSVEANIGKLLLDAGKLTEMDIERIVRAQREKNRRFGEAAVQLGLVEEEDILRVLARQFKYPCLLASTRLSEHLVIVHQPFGLQAEALRMLRSQLLLRWFGGQRKKLALISCCAEEGCSGLAANLAIAFSQSGVRTLLIDADMRTPSLHTFFGIGNSVGLSELLAGRSKITAAIQQIDGLANFALLGGGAPPPNPQELLGRPAFDDLLEAISSQYDIILFNTPPALSSADAQLIAARAGGGLLVTRRHQTRLDEVLKVKEHLNAADVEIVGAVLGE